MNFKLSFLLLSAVLLASSVATAQLPYYYSPFPNAGLRIYNAFVRGLFSVVNAVEEEINIDLTHTEYDIRQLNSAVGITGNIPQVIGQVNEWKLNFLRRTSLRIRSTVALVLLKLRETVQHIQQQYVRTPHVERILNELLRIGYFGVGKIIRIAAKTALRVSQLVYHASEFVENLHEEALQSGPGYRNVYENLFERKLDRVEEQANRNIYGGFRQINRAVNNAVDESRYELSNL